jgi:hypothetical protein
LVVGLHVFFVLVRIQVVVEIFLERVYGFRFQNVVIHQTNDTLELADVVLMVGDVQL